MVWRIACPVRQAGVDFIKDDELQADGPACRFDAPAAMQVINAHADRSGRKVMQALNVTREINQMQRRHDLVQALGCTCVMASLIAVGIAGIVALRRHAVLPINAHRNGWGADPGAAIGVRPCRLVENLAHRRGRPHACERLAEQVQRPGSQCHRLGQVTANAALAGRPLYADAGVFHWSVGGAGAWHMGGTGVGLEVAARADKAHVAAVGFGR